jgi:deoxyhypusine synthase
LRKVANIKKMMIELEPLDLNKCNTVADIVLAMNRCSFGARMLAEVTLKIADWIKAQQVPTAIYDGKLDTPLGELLQEMVKRQWLQKLVSPQEYTESSDSGQKVLIIGLFSEKYQSALYNKPEEAIYINSYGIAKPGQIADGYFPNVVFCDPKLIIPLIFTCLEQILLGKPTSITEFMDSIQIYGGVAEEMSQGAKTLLAMVQDPDCSVFLTLSGAMTIAKMGLIICDLIDNNMVQAICSTGALMAHGLIESVGLKHLKYNPNDDDALLAKQKMNRVTDTLEPETNFDQIESMIRKILDNYDSKEYLSPTVFHHLIGEYLAKNYADKRGILKSAYEKKVPIFVPAFVDSEIGNDVYVYNYKRRKKHKKPIIFDLELDTKKLVELAIKAKKIGIFTIGGGVPRNNTQNVSPLIDIINERTKENLPKRKFAYGCRICPEPMYYGNLSGCTYSEGMSWRKMKVNGLFSEIHADATIIWPFLVKYVREVVKD